MTRVSARAPIPLPIEVCWEKLRDLERAHFYVPGVSACVITTDAREGVGASRRVTSRQVGDMDETVVVWDEGRALTIRLHKGDAPARPFREATFRYALEPAGEHCEIVTRMEYDLVGGPLGRLLDALVMRRQMQRNVRDVALALAEHYVTDAPVPPERLEALRRNAST